MRGGPEAAATARRTPMPKPRSGVRMVPMPKPATAEIAPAANAAAKMSSAKVKSARSISTTYHSRMRSALALLFLATSAMAQEQIAADRPGIADGSQTVGRGTFQFELRWARESYAV